jgi:hypothetical protein
MKNIKQKKSEVGAYLWENEMGEESLLHQDNLQH